MSLKKSIRKALEAPLKAAAEANNVVLPAVSPVAAAIEWPNLKFDRKRPGLVGFYRFSIHYGPTEILEIGPNPLKKRTGFIKIGCFTTIATGEDYNDDIAGFAEDAYPYGTKLTFDGVDVIVDKVDSRDAVPADEAWYYAPVDVHWTVWRRP